jgi:hypothetical protein
MFVEEPPRTPPSLIIAIALSLLLHGLVLFVSRQPPESQDRPARRIEASLATPQVKPKPITPPAAVPATTPPQQSPAKAPVRKKVLAVDKSKAHKTSPSKPEWFRIVQLFQAEQADAEGAEIGRFVALQRHAGSGLQAGGEEFLADWISGSVV